MIQEKNVSPEEKERRNVQTTDTVLLVYPDTFRFNPETATSNAFMKLPPDLTEDQTNLLARAEFEKVVETLKSEGINTLVIHGPDGEETPDGVFPNNWISHHDDTLIFYPMRNKSRSLERQPKKVLEALRKAHFAEPRILDLTFHEQVRGIEVRKDGVEMSVCLEALEGTGSMVLDRVNKVAYAIESPRTTKKVFDEWCEAMGYEGIFFHASNMEGPIYHTNVIMGIGQEFAVVSFESIQDTDERDMVAKKIAESDREVIDITLDQVSAFCGNLLELQSADGQPKIVMSKLAWENFSKDQAAQLEQFGKIVTIKMPTIEYAGGSARCILAEVFASVSPK